MEVHVSEETLREMENIFKENDVEVETVQIGNKDIRISGYQDIRISGYQDIRGCIACHSCATKGKCVFDDVVNELAPKFERIACWNVTCGWCRRNSGRREGLVSC